jgi:hypothetical protein
MFGVGLDTFLRVGEGVMVTDVTLTSACHLAWPKERLVRTNSTHTKDILLIVLLICCFILFIVCGLVVKWIIVTSGSNVAMQQVVVTHPKQWLNMNTVKITW